MFWSGFWLFSPFVYVWSLGVAALGVSNDFSIAGVEFYTDEEEKAENQRLKSNVAVNNNVNNNSTKKVQYSDGRNQINLALNMQEYHINQEYKH